MEQVGVRPPDLRSDGFERHGLGTSFEQDPDCRVERGGPAFRRAEAFSSY
jgi:hypothetical protein